MTKDTGGPAFPIWQENMNVEGTPGMSLRDYFAAEIRAGMGMWTPDRLKRHNSSVPPLTLAEQRAARAQWAYEEADAMLAERNKP